MKEFDLKAKFHIFQEICLIAVYFSEDMHSDEITEVINDWFVIYKDSGYNDVKAFLVEQQLPDVTRETHSFWLDPRGVLLLDLKYKVR